MPKYDIWHDRQEQWDPANIDPPARRVDARDVEEAAAQFTECEDRDFVELIIRDEAGDFYEVKCRRTYDVTVGPTTLAALSAE